MVTGMVEAIMKYQHDDRSSGVGESQRKVTSTIAYELTEVSNQVNKAHASPENVELEPGPVLIEFLEEWNGLEEADETNFEI